MVRIKEGESRTYTVPLRKDSLKVAKWKRSKRTVSNIQNFLTKHTKKENIKIGRWLNELIWQHGAKNPPARVRVNVKVEGDKAIAELAELSPRAKKIEEARKKAEEAEKKKDKKEKEAPVEAVKKEVKAEKTKKKESKNVKKAEKKASKKDLKKELEAAKDAEKKREQKKKAVPTKKQSMQMK